MPHQAVLPAPWRSRAGHVTPAHLDRTRPGPDAGVARTAVRPVPAYLRARHPGRPRQVADRAELFVAGRSGLRPDRGLQRRIALLSAGDVIRRPGPWFGGAALHLSASVKRNIVRRWRRASNR